jgi:uncharacterized repeat protein (TIGR03803 family)
MKYSGILVGAFLSSALLAACGGNSGFSTPNSILPPASSSISEPKSAGEQILYSFQGGTDGEFPYGALTYNNDVLYGTTQNGGGSKCSDYNSGPGCGTVFQISTVGSKYGVLHRFAENGLGGELPDGGVTYAGGMLYGATTFGGGRGDKKFSACGADAGCGTVFERDPSHSDSFKILHRFDATDGLYASPSLLDGNGTVYGATLAGGAYQCYGANGGGCGTLYSVTNSTFKSFHDFKGGAEGARPFSPPILFNGWLYGTTGLGGTCKHPPSGLSGCGVIYKVKPDGSDFKPLYLFKGGKDGANVNNVIQVKGALYGTTNDGGDPSCSTPSGGECGIVFRIDPNGNGFRVLHAFKGGDDGASPNQIWADINGTIYSDTTDGGTAGHGVVFGIDTSKTDTKSRGYEVVYSFKGGTDGANPSGNGPIAVGGTLYGTTTLGGGSGCGGSGCGTVFEVTP